MKKLIFTRKKRNTKRTVRSSRSISKGILSIAALLIISLFINFIPTTVQAKEEKEPTSYESVLVSNGDSLWSIAKDYNTCDISTNEFIDEIKEINGISGDSINSDNYILVPIYE